MQAFPDSLRRSLLRFLAAMLLLGSAAAYGQQALVEALVPVFRAWLVVVDNSLRTIELQVVQEGRDLVLRRRSEVVDWAGLGMKAPPIGVSAQLDSSVVVGNVLQAPLFGLALLLAWPWVRARELALRMTLAWPLLLLMLLLDTPLVLYGVAWNSVLASFAPGRQSLLVSWGDAMNVGGRFVMACLLCGVIIHLARRWTAPGGERRAGAA